VSYKAYAILSEKRLVDKILSGDRHAFTFLLKNTEGLVSNMIFKMIPIPGDRKDLAQDVYLKAFKNLSQFKFQSKLSTWIGQITYNTCLHYLEKMKVTLLENYESLEEPNDDRIDRQLDNNPGISLQETEQLFYRRELSSILDTAIDQLSPIYKTLITLYHQEDLSYQEIAEITSLPDGTVQNYLFRARKALKKYILLKYQKEDL
jgi:RNA polymerase sigma factor (sigma-70 family)